MAVPSSQQSRTFRAVSVLNVLPLLGNLFAVR
jgi:hypothetical protein